MNFNKESNFIGGLKILKRGVKFRISVSIFIIIKQNPSRNKFDNCLRKILNVLYSFKKKLFALYNYAMLLNKMFLTPK